MTTRPEDHSSCGPEVAHWNRGNPRFCSEFL